MDEHLHNIDKLFKSAVNGYEETPPPGVWDAVDQQLDKRNIISIKKKYAYLKRTLVAAMLLLSVASLFALLTWHTGRQPLHALHINTSKKTIRQQATGKAFERLDHPATALPAPETYANANAAVKEKATYQADSIGTINSGITPALVIAHQPRAGTPEQPGLTAATRNKKPAMGVAPWRTALLPAASNNVESIVTAPNNNGRSGKTTGTVTQSPVAVSTLPAPVQLMYAIQTTKSLSTARQGVASMPGTNSQSQTIQLSTPRRHVLSATVFVAPGIAVNRLETDRAKYREDDKNAISKAERNKVSFMAGVTADLSIGHNFSIQSGIAFSNTVKTIEPKYIFARFDNRGNIQYRYNCSSGYYFIAPKAGNIPHYGDSISVSGSTNTLQYLSIPLAVKYKVEKGKFSIQPLVGAAVNILTKQKVETAVIAGGNTVQQEQDGITGLKPVYFSGVLSIEAEWQLSRRFALRVAPVGRFAITSMNKEASVKTYPVYAGLATGITVKL